MHKVRVMQSFGAPRPTTNPYIVMLRDSLVASTEIEHIPFSWRTALTGSYDIFHVHWPDTLLDGRSRLTRLGKRAAFTALLLRLRSKRTPVVRTVHNLAGPEGIAIDRMLILALSRRETLHILISDSSPARPGIPSALILHGHYRSWYAARNQVGATPGRLGYVGLIKPYKGVDALISAFVRARELDPTITLDISGKPTDAATFSDIRQAEATASGLNATLRYVDEQEFVDAITRASVIVLPYRHMHNSGTALAALSLGRPVLAPDNPTTRALSAEVGPGWMHLFVGDLQPEDLLAALAAARESTTVLPDLSARDWSNTARLHSAAYRRALRAARGSDSNLSTSKKSAHG